MKHTLITGINVMRLALDRLKSERDTLGYRIHTILSAYLVGNVFRSALFTPVFNILLNEENGINNHLQARFGETAAHFMEEAIASFFSSDALKKYRLL